MKCSDAQDRRTIHGSLKYYRRREKTYAKRGTRMERNWRRTGVERCLEALADQVLTTRACFEKVHGICHWENISTYRVQHSTLLFITPFAGKAHCLAIWVARLLSRHRCSKRLAAEVYNTLWISYLVNSFAKRKTCKTQQHIRLRHPILNSHTGRWRFLQQSRYTLKINLWEGDAVSTRTLPTLSGRPITST